MCLLNMHPLNSTEVVIRRTANSMAKEKLKIKEKKTKQTNKQANKKTKK